MSSPSTDYTPGPERGVLAFRLENFMAFGEQPPESSWIELRPITLLFGRNSSGKSAIIRALRLLKQSLYYAKKPGPEDEAGEPFAYNVEDGVDVGSFLTIAHGSDNQSYKYDPPPPDGPYWAEKNAIRFSFRFSVPMDKVPDWLLSTQEQDLLSEKGLPPLRQDEALVELTLSYGLFDAKNPHGDLTELELDVARNATKRENRRRIFHAIRLPNLTGFGKQNLDLLGDWWFGSDLLSVPATGERSFWCNVELCLDEAFLPTLRFGAEEEQVPLLVADVEAILKVGRYHIRDFLGGMQYVPPLRPVPRRLYLLDDAEQRRWGHRGFHALVRVLVNGQDDPISDRLIPWLNTLDSRVNGFLPRNLLKDLEQYRDQYINAACTKIELTEADKDGHPREVNLADVGFGTSQVIPVLLAALTAEPGQLVIIEQPELHLHPGAQVKLADLFIERINEGCMFLLETHSEHLLLRLRRRIAETTARILPTENLGLQSEQLKVYCVDRADGESRSSVVELDNLGGFRTEPPCILGFFSDDGDEIAGRTWAAIKATEE